VFLAAEEGDDAEVVRGDFLGETHVAFADGPQAARVEHHHALQALDGAQHGEDLIETTADLVEEAQLDLVQPLVHPVTTLPRFLPSPHEQLAPHAVPRLKVNSRYALVALFDHLRLE
jgi:hypothetical protein